MVDSNNVKKNQQAISDTKNYLPFNFVYKHLNTCINLIFIKGKKFFYRTLKNLSESKTAAICSSLNPENYYIFLHCIKIWFSLIIIIKWRKDII